MDNRRYRSDAEISKDKKKCTPKKMNNNFTENYYPLNKMLLCYFEFEHSIDLTNIKTCPQFFQNNRKFEDEIITYLIDMAQGVISASFCLLVNDQCKQHEMKCYASKNILQNIKYLCLRISRIINENQQQYVTILNQTKEKELRIKQIEQLPTLKRIDYQLKLKRQQQRRQKKIQQERKQKKLEEQIRQIKIKRKKFQESRKIIQKNLQMISLNKNKNDKTEETKETQQKQQELSREEMIDNLIIKIIQFICSELKVIINEISNNYPNTPISGFSQRLIDKIKTIDIRQDYAYQFLYLHQIVIEESDNQEQYISKMMQFMNSAIKAPYEPIRNIDGQTYYQCFIQFNRNLAWITSQSTITQKDISKQNHKQNQIIEFLVEPSEQNTMKLKRFIKKHQKIKDDTLVITKIEEDIQRYERQHKVISNAKIQRNTLNFKQEQIKNCQLKIKASSLLRLLTKWVQDLQQTLQDNQKYLRDNCFCFKIVQENYNQEGEKENEFKLIKFNEKQRKILSNAAKKVSIQKNPINNMFVIDSLLEQQPQIKYNFESSLKFSSQINAFISKQTVKQLIKLFKILLKIPKQVQRQIQKQFDKKQYLFVNNKQKQRLKKSLEEVKKVNLICNRVGDLLRSKISCTEPQFIKLLTIIYELDRYCSNKKPCFFKLIRIKNKLEQASNNILVNYMFYEKIQCELQICFLNQRHDKTQKSNAMHHFLYELKRGLFGVIPELANIVNQNDPACRPSSLSNLKIQKYFSKQYKFDQYQVRKLTKSQKCNYVWRCIYKKCGQYSLQSSSKFIKKDDEQNSYQCLTCYLDLNKNKQNIFISLSKLKYSKQDEWVKELLVKYSDLQLQQIKQGMTDQDPRGLYLMIYPTQKKIIVQMFIIFQQTQSQQYIVKYLEQGNNIHAREITKKIYKDHINNRKQMHIKLNYYLFKQYLKQIQMKKYLSCLSEDNINHQIKKKALVQVNLSRLKEQIEERQENIRIKQQQIFDQFQIQAKKQSLVFLQRLYADGLRKDISFYKNFQNLKQLYIPDNSIFGKICIEDYKYLTCIDLSQNNIQSIRFANTPSIKEIILNSNRLNQFQYQHLDTLQTLSMQSNYFVGRLCFQEQLPSLNHLNLSLNDLNQVDIRNCPSLKKLNCFNYRKHIHIISHQQMYLEDLTARYLSHQTLQSLKGDHLLTIELYSSINGIQLLQKKFNQLKHIKIIQGEQREMQLIMAKNIKEIKREAKTQKMKQIQKWVKMINKVEFQLFSLFKEQQINIEQLIQLHQILKGLSIISNCKQEEKQQGQEQLFSNFISLFQSTQRLNSYQSEHIKKINKIESLIQQLKNHLYNNYQTHFNSQKILEDFIINQHQIVSVYININNNIKTLDLTNAKHIQRLTIKSEYLQQLKLKSVSKINIKAPKLKQLFVQHNETVTQFNGKSMKNMETLSFSQFENIEKINIENALLLNYLFQHLKLVETITIDNAISNHKPLQVQTFKCIDNPLLQAIRLQRLMMRQLQVSSCNQLQVLELIFGNKKHIIKKAHIQLPKLKQLRLYNCFIDDLKLTISAKCIKKIILILILIKKSQISFYEGSKSKIDLQELHLYNYTYFFSQTLKALFRQINTIKTLNYNIKSFPQKSAIYDGFEEFFDYSGFSLDQAYKLRLSNICSNVEQLILSVLYDTYDIPTISIDSPIKNIELGAHKRCLILSFEQGASVQIKNIQNFQKCEMVQFVNLTNEKVLINFKVDYKYIEEYKSIIKIFGQIQVKLEPIEPNQLFNL